MARHRINTDLIARHWDDLLPVAGSLKPGVVAGHKLGVLWASASRGATVRELRAAIGLTRERLEAAYAYLLEYPLLGLTVMRHGDEFQLVTNGLVAACAAACQPVGGGPCRC